MMLLLALIGLGVRVLGRSRHFHESDIAFSSPEMKSFAVARVDVRQHGLVWGEAEEVLAVVLALPAQ